MLQPPFVSLCVFASGQVTPGGAASTMSAFCAFGKRRLGPDILVCDQPGSLFGCACCCLRLLPERNHHLTHSRVTAPGVMMAILTQSRSFFGRFWILS